MTYHFVPLACKTLDPINNSDHLFITQWGETREKPANFISAFPTPSNTLTLNIAFIGSFVPQDLDES